MHTLESSNEGSADRVLDAHGGDLHELPAPGFGLSPAQVTANIWEVHQWTELEGVIFLTLPFKQTNKKFV